MTPRRALVVLLAVVLAGWTAYDHVQDWKAGRKGSQQIGAVLQADFSLKAADAYRGMGLAPMAKQFDDQAERSLTEASAAKDAEPSVLIRLGILDGEKGKLGAAQSHFALARQKSPFVADRRRAEALERIYNGSAIPAAEIPKIKAALEPDGKWYRKVAMARAYRNAGMDKQADELRKQMEDSAKSQVIGFMLLLALMVPAGLLGLVLDGVFVYYWAVGKLPSLKWTLGAWALFEAFIAWYAADTLANLGLRALAGSLKQGPTMAHLVSRLGLTIGLELLLLAVPLLVLRSWTGRMREALDEIGLHWRDFWKNVAWGIGGYLGTLILLAVILVVTSVLSRVFNMDRITPANPAVPILMSSHGFAQRLMVLLLVSVMAPLVEETVFRGILYGAIRRRWGVLPGVLISAAIFASLHRQLPMGFLPIFALGAAFALLYEKRGSLVPGMVAHGLNNGVLFVMLMMMGG